MFKRKFTRIDFAIILLLIVGIIGISYKFSKAEIAAPATDKEKLLITYYMENVPDSTLQSIKSGDPVRETVQSSDFGKVVEISSGESIFWRNREDGQFVSSPKEGYSSLYITMETQGIINKSGVSIDKSVYYVGDSISLYAGNAILEGGKISKVVKANK